jgi:hypothetical protein
MEENNEKVVVSEKEMAQIDKEITQVESTKIEEAKKAGAEEVRSTVLPSLEEIRKRQEELERKIAMKELEDKERLLKELEQRPQRRGVVPESSNPIKPQEPAKAEVKMPSNEEMWSAMETASRNGMFRASIDVKKK